MQLFHKEISCIQRLLHISHSAIRIMLTMMMTVVKPINANVRNTITPPSSPYIRTVDNPYAYLHTVLAYKPLQALSYLPNSTSDRYQKYNFQTDRNGSFQASPCLLLLCCSWLSSSVSQVHYTHTSFSSLSLSPVASLAFLLQPFFLMPVSIAMNT